MPHGEDRAYRKAELGGRCLVARGLNKNRNTVIGIAFVIKTIAYKCILSIQG